MPVLGRQMRAALAFPGTLEPADATLSRAREGDLGAFEALVRRHERMVFSLALHVLHDQAAAEDVAQEVFLQLYRHLEQIESDAHLTFWLRRVAGHRAIDVTRREGSRRYVGLDQAPVLSLVRRDRDPFLERGIRQLVKQLPARARLVMALRYQEDLEPGEIAALLGVPLNTVKSQLKRALAVLRARAAQLGGAGR